MPTDPQTPKDTTHEQQDLAKKIFEGCPIDIDFPQQYLQTPVEEICNTEHVCNTQVILDGKLLKDAVPITILPSPPFNPDNARTLMKRMEQEVTATMLIPKELLR